MAIVKVIMVRQRKDGSVKDAALLPGRWEVVDMVPRDDGKGVDGIVEPLASTRPQPVALLL
jgi:hypothetical protein